MASREEAREASRPTGSGTSVSGYVDTPVAKRCGTCEYLRDVHLCNNKRVRKDPELETDPVTGFKIVNPVSGCCSFWEVADGEA